MAAITIRSLEDLNRIDNNILLNNASYIDLLNHLYWNVKSDNGIGMRKVDAMIMITELKDILEDHSA